LVREIKVKLEVIDKYSFDFWSADKGTWIWESTDNPGIMKFPDEKTLLEYSQTHEGSFQMIGIDKYSKEVIVRRLK